MESWQQIKFLILKLHFIRISIQDNNHQEKTLKFFRSEIAIQ